MTATSATRAMQTSPASTETSLRGAVAQGVLRGLTLTCAPKLTLLLDADGEGASPGPAACALRLLAGVGRPSAGVVRSLGVDPARSPALRRDIALLGDDALLPSNVPLEELVVALARVRGVDDLASRDGVRALLRDQPSPTIARKIVADRLAAPSRARLLLVSHPERWTEPARRAEVSRTIASALDRGAQVVVATTRLDDWLHVAHASDALAVLIAGGVAVAAGPAHGLPWAVPADGAVVRLVRVAVADSETENETARAPAAQRLAADLFADAEIAPKIVAIEAVSPTELRIHTRDPRALATAITKRAADGLDVRKLVVQGSTASALAQSLTQGRR